MIKQNILQFFNVNHFNILDLAIWLVFSSTLFVVLCSVVSVALGDVGSMALKRMIVKNISSLSIWHMLPWDDILCHGLSHIQCGTSCGKASYMLSCTLCGTPSENVVLHMKIYSFYIFKNIQLDYRVIHSLVFISALLVRASMMMVPMVWVGVQTRRQEDSSLEGGE